ncbi:zinc finger BED domain-containing RICESLEEPER 2-like [Olea europaea subsp. europaea]|uniref:Zinc finger BED domain-containing RICESLEEPER 2-like n=1 Tax=Olea europaea subsp. europaea TaxID=158383 RepID=A0A8S0PSJ7_OLEEU|nr:zinc finger BED domain-containing RICESLEEPER 2-like [Olea europaea subsp. europaea]
MNHVDLSEEENYLEPNVAVDSVEVDQYPYSTKGKKGGKRYDVWDHFKLHDEKAECIYCGQLYKYGNKNAGTCTLRNHVECLCKKYPYRVPEKKQKTMSYYTKSKNDVLEGITNSGPVVKFTQKGTREMIAKYLLAELPFRHVQDEGFRLYTKYFFPTFEFPSRVTVAKDIYQLYLDEKKKLKKELSRHRVCLTTDCWTSIQNISYMCLTAHWVDDDWILEKRIISFIQVPSHKGNMVAKELIYCLHDWGIKKIFCVTVGNASSNDVAISKLKESFQETKHGLILDGEMLHMRCCAHILNLIVCDGLKEISSSISSIRNVVRFTRSSPARLKRFRESCKEVNIESRALLCLDVTTRWNSTYLAKDPNSLMGKMAISKRRKQDKYWGNHEKFNDLLFIATVLDPRCKLELLKVGFEIMYNEEIAKKMLAKVENSIHRLYNYYKEMMHSPSNEMSQTSSQSQQPTLGISRPIPSIFKARLNRDARLEKNDLVDYLSDRCDDLTEEPFDILMWWKINAPKYKIVSQIAKDVLAIQISTVASESAFSTGGRILDSFRSSLGAQMVEACICGKNWLQTKKEPIVLRQYLDEVEALDDSMKVVAGDSYFLLPYF